MSIKKLHHSFVYIFLLSTLCWTMPVLSLEKSVPSLVYITARKVAQEIFEGKLNKESINVPAEVRSSIDFLLPFYAYDADGTTNFRSASALRRALQQNNTTMIENILKDLRTNATTLEAFKQETKDLYLTNPKHMLSKLIREAITKANGNIIEFLLTEQIINANEHISYMQQNTQFLGSLLEEVARSGSLDLFNIMLKHNASFDTPFILSAIAKGGNIDMLQLVLDKGLDIRQEENDPLESAAAAGKLAMFNVLVQKGLDIHQPFLLKHAVEGGNSAIVQQVLAAGANINEPDWDGKIPLFYALNNEVMFDFLIRHGANIRARDLLSEAIKRGTQNIVKRIITAGVDINSHDSFGNPPLFYSMMPGAMFFFLVQQGASLSVRSSDGKTVLHRAVEVGNPLITKYLIQHKLDVNAQDKSGRTPLFLVSNKAVAELLIHAGADVNHKNDNNDTPLHAIISRPVMRTAQTRELINYLTSSLDSLVSRGLELNSVNNKGQTPLDIAIERHWPSIAQVLKSHGAQRGPFLKRIWRTL